MAIYSNITRLKAVEKAVSKGKIDYVAGAPFPINDTPPYTFWFQYIGDATYSPVYPSAVNNQVILNEGVQPRGIVFSSDSSLNTMVRGGGPYPSNTTQTTSRFCTNFSSPIYEGIDDPDEDDPFTGNLESPGFSFFPDYKPYVGNWRIPYSSKTFPIFATGDNQNGGYHNNSNYALLRLLDFDLPYVKCNILQGEVSIGCPGISSDYAAGASPSDPTIVNIMTRDVMYQYPLYNAIEVMIATKSLFYGDSNVTPHGGCWLRKTFLISWKLKEFTETPFPEITNQTITRKYWYPSGLLPSDASGTNSDFVWERYSNYVYDAPSVNNQNPNNEEYETPDSTWFQDYLYPPTHFYNDESPLEIIENDSEKKATIKINGITRRGTDSLNHKNFVAKGLAKLI